MAKSFDLKGAFRYAYAYRDLLVNLIAKEITVRHLGAFGILWAVVHPFIIILMYLFIFTYIFHPLQNNHALYIVTGIMHWNLFNQTFNQSCGFLTANAAILTKIRFPRILVAVAGTLVNVFLWLLAFIVYLLMIPWLGGTFSFSLLAYPFFVVLYIGFIFGLSLIIATSNVVFRDTTNFVRLLTRLLFWATPIIYPVTRLPEAAQNIIVLSPIAEFILIFESLFFHNQLPSISLVLGSILWTVAVLSTGLYLFRANVNSLIERL